MRAASLGAKPALGSRPPPVPSRASNRVRKPFDPSNPVKPGTDVLRAYVANSQKLSGPAGDSPRTQEAPNGRSNLSSKQSSPESKQTPAKPIPKTVGATPRQTLPGARSRIFSPGGGSPALQNSGSGVASGSVSTPLRQTSPSEPELAKTNLFVRVARRGVSLFKRLSLGPT